MVTQQILHEHNRHGFEWPEPLIIDLVSEHYADAAPRERIVVARLHARALRQQVEGDRRAAALCRLDLLAACAARGIGVAAIEAADRSVFDELLAIAKGRYRLSPQRRDAMMERLAEALRGLDPVREPPKPASRALRPVAIRPATIKARPARGLATA